MIGREIEDSDRSNDALAIASGALKRRAGITDFQRIMVAISALCLLAYSVGSVAVGIRLLLRARVTRGVPELLAGLTYLCAPGIGYPLQVVGAQLPMRAVAVPMNVAGECLIVFGLSCFLFFTVTVFRPSARWAKWSAWLGTLALLYVGIVINYAAITYSNPAESQAHVRPAVATVLTVLALAWGWTALEGLRYYRMMKKRMALGLADPVVTNRFLLWGLNGLTSMGWLSVSVLVFLAGGNLATSPLVVSATSGGGFANTIFLLLIFMPPAAYTRWIERSARAPQLATV